MRLHRKNFVARLLRRFAAAAVTLVPAVSVMADGLEEPSTIAIVVHKDTQIDELSLAGLRDVFLADQQFWPDRTRITLLFRAPQSKEREFVLSRIYEMSEAQFRKYWIGKMFRAEVPRGPKNVFSSEAALDLVVAIPGSISFIRADEVTEDVKVIRINGALPGEAGYPLR